MTLRVFLAAVKRHRKTFAITATAVFAVGLIWLLLTPAKYVSTTRLMVSVEGSTTAAAYQNDEVVAGRINTYIALLTTDAVTQRVIDKLKLPESPQELAEQGERDDCSTAHVTHRHCGHRRIGRPRTLDRTDARRRIHQVCRRDGDADRRRRSEGAHNRRDRRDGPAQQRAERVALGGLAALAALILGAAAVWIRSAKDPVLAMAKQDAASGDVPPTKTTAPARRAPSMSPPGPRRLPDADCGQ